MKGKIILLEDVERIAKYYKKMLEQEGYKVHIALNSTEFFQIYEQFQPDLILLDIVLKNSELNGIEVFRELQSKQDFTAKVIVLSSEATKTEVVEAMKLGAVNFNEKGENFNRIKFLADINQALSLKNREEEIHDLKKQSIDSVLYGKHPSMLKLKDEIGKFARSNMNLLITGETGTGKGLVAELLHQNSPRNNKPFKSIDIKSVPRSLLESELFGHKKGAFTGANYDKQGYFEAAHQGTLFIDEISNMSLEDQAKLLKVIDEKKIPIIGSGGVTKEIDTRIISATNRDLREMIGKGEFRKDLYFRFANCNIHLPPLRERASDITYLMEKFLIDYSREFNKSLDIDLKQLKTRLESYEFPGNVRELKNLCRFTAEFHNKIDNHILLQEFEDHVQHNHRLTEPSEKSQRETYNRIFENENLYESMQKFEKKFIEFHLRKNHGRIGKTADSIGLDRTTLYKKMKKYNIEKP